MKFSEVRDPKVVKVAIPVAAHPSRKHDTLTTADAANENLYVQLGNGYPVLRWIRDEVLMQIRTALPGLVGGTKYKLEQIYDRTAWHRLHPDERKIAGKCMASLVATKVVPLHHMGRNSANAALYQLL